MTEASRDWTRRPAVVRWIARRFAKRARPLLAEAHGPETTNRILAVADRELEALIPELPDIGGGKNVFAPVLTINAWLIALHRGMKSEGRTAQDTIRVASRIFDDFFAAMPQWLLGLSGRSLLRPTARRFFTRQAARSQERAHPEDFVWQIEETPDGEFSFVFSECAVNKFYDRHDLEDLKPYCNFFDVTYSRLMGMGIDATETIGQGCEKCALRFKHGRDTSIPSPLQGVIPRT